MIRIEAAAGCSKGLRRANNEDNLYFDGRILEQEHEGLRHALSCGFSVEDRRCLAVFDGMGGEAAGEVASFCAAQAMQAYFRSDTGYLKNTRDVLNELCTQMNLRVCEASEEMLTGRMGSTVTALYFADGRVYVCNLGDSKAFRLRDNELLQISEDHVETLPEGSRRKPGLTQHLGIFPEELRLVPHLAKGELRAGDQYLICSDGLTDMLNHVEICAILKETGDVRQCVDTLIEKANENGGRDNITVIVCRVTE